MKKLTQIMAFDFNLEFPKTSLQLSLPNHSSSTRDLAQDWIP